MDWIHLVWHGDSWCEISGSHSGKYEDGCLLGCCCTMYVVWQKFIPDLHGNKPFDSLKEGEFLD
jgi:hypothetical protein